MNIYYGLLLFFIGQTLSWFQSNSTIVGENMGNKALLRRGSLAPQAVGRMKNKLSGMGLNRHRRSCN